MRSIHATTGVEPLMTTLGDSARFDPLMPAVERDAPRAAHAEPFHRATRMLVFPVASVSAHATTGFVPSSAMLGERDAPEVALMPPPCALPASCVHVPPWKRAT